MTLQELIEAAQKRGYTDGSDAADWYFDEGRTSVSRDDYRRVLTGIADGDPEIMDTLPCADLSGQWADGLVPVRLAEELGASELQLRNWEETNELDEILTAYEDAYSSSAQDTIEAHCHTMLEQDVRFILEVRTELEPEQLLSKLFDLLASENCDMLSDEFEID